ncbi:hypothetical protein ACFY3N_17065 [Streptomyces sp. NPDC000348]|uniref:hypothetical protein n=1 Tax=Streptomyces sp. NPDC000348 TaxID=3364538 RepID=UPI0036A402B6
MKRPAGVPLHALTALMLMLAAALPAPAAVAEARNADASDVRGTPVEDLHQDPIGRMAYVERRARHLGSPGETRRVLAIGFVDITGFDDLLTKGYEVFDSAELKQSNPALHRQLRLDERPRIDRFMTIARTNDRSVWRKNELVLQGKHAEERVLNDVMNLHVPASRLFAVYADFSPCITKCSRQLPPEADVFFGTVYRKSGYTMKLESLFTEASGAAGRDPAFQEEVAAAKVRLEDLKEANSRRRYDEARRKNKTARKMKRLFRTEQGGACGQQNLAVRLTLVPQSAAKGPHCGAGPGTATTGLLKALTEPASKIGGIDFSSMRLRYLSDPGDGSGLQYSFSARSDPMHGDLRTSSGLEAARQTSDAFFVWLSLSPQDFWVNLSPDEPDRIVDDQLGRTDAGRILLEADLQMKKTVGKLIHPHTALGKRYWDGIRGDCVSSRNWIVPAPASVHQDGDKLYILDAPLDVKMEAHYVAASGRPADTPTCPRQDRATEEHNERLERTLVLPRLRKAINTAPEYAALRRVYLARVAAEWYRELSTTKATTYGELMNSGDITDWPVTGDWTPQDTFDKAVESYTKGEYTVTDRTISGGTAHVRRYVYGGVDFISVPVRKLSSNAFGADFATLPVSVDRSLHAPSFTGRDDTVWLGAPTPRQAATGLGPTQKPVSAGTWAIRLLPALIIPVALLLWRRRRRLNTRSASPLRRAATGGPPRRP